MTRFRSRAIPGAGLGAILLATGAAVLLQWCSVPAPVAMPNVADGASPSLRVRAGLPSQQAPGEVRGLDPETFRTRSRIAAAEAQTARMMILLVEFPEEVPHDPATTGNGLFERTFSDRYAINQPPHDQPYFERQCQAAKNYFSAASKGRLTLEWQIFPSATDDPQFYEMPNKMRYYNPDTTEAALNERLAEFFRDAVVAADQTAGGALPFDQFDYYVIFHAGVGLDLIIDDSTPSDIPSAFLSAAEVREFLGEGPDWPGIAVQGGSHHVTEGLWLPETENQQGFEFALTGVFGQLLGSQLGLPILWNPDSGAPGIGRFGLMDQGGGNLDGIVPAFPTAWSRLDRGWAEAVVITDSTGVAIAALGAMEAGAELVVVPVDEREYFIIENRKKDVNGDGELIVNSDTSVPISVVADEYDYGIPGSGVLIWHIDQQVIDATRAENRVNADYRHRGVKLLEADGLDDIGLRPEGGFGLPEDAYFAGNNDALTPTSIPSSASNYGALTHVMVTAISDTGNVMRCDVSNDAFLPGWPDSSGIAYPAVPPAVGDVDGDGEDEIVVADSLGAYVFGANGTREALLDAAPPRLTRVLIVDARAVASCPGCAEIVASLENGAINVYDAAFDLIETLLPPMSDETGAPELVSVPFVSAADLSGDGAYEILAAREGSIYLWRNGTAIPGSPLATLWSDETIYVGGTRGELDTIDLVAVSAAGRVAGYRRPAGGEGEYVLALDAGTGHVPAGPPVIGDLDRDGLAEIVFVTADARLVAFALDRRPGTSEVVGLNLMAGWPVVLDSAAGTPSLGDIDGDGRPDVIVGDANRIRAIGFNGIRLEGWPITLQPFEDGGEVFAEPLVADVDGDGGQDVVLASPDGLLRAYRGDGAAVAGWPIPAGRTHRMPPAITAAANGGLFIPGSGTGWMYGFTVDGDAAGSAHWPVAGGSAGRSGVLPTARVGDVTTPGSFFPESSLTVYPNPAYESVRFRYFLGEAATVTIDLHDLTGVKIASVDAPGQGGVMNEAEWDLRNGDGAPVAPGLYLATVTARGGSGSNSHRTRLAVVK